MIVPGPARGRVDLETDLSAQALTGGDADRFRGFGHARFHHYRHCKERSDEAIQSFFAVSWIASLRSQ
jgi:hypothetical protein